MAGWAALVTQGDGCRRELAVMFILACKSNTFGDLIIRNKKAF